jgi:hypothetical protein
VTEQPGRCVEKSTRTHVENGSTGNYFSGPALSASTRNFFSTRRADCRASGRHVPLNSKYNQGLDVPGVEPISHRHAILISDSSCTTIADQLFRLVLAYQKFCGPRLQIAFVQLKKYAI